MRIKKGKRVQTDFPKDSYKLIINFRHNDCVESDEFTFRNKEADEMYDLEMLMPWLHAIATTDYSCSDMECVAEVAGIDMKNVQQYDTFVEYWQTENTDDTYTIPAELESYELFYYDLNGNKYECRYE